MAGGAIRFVELGADPAVVLFGRPGREVGAAHWGELRHDSPGSDRRTSRWGSVLAVPIVTSIPVVARDETVRDLPRVMENKSHRIAIVSDLAYIALIPACIRTFRERIARAVHAVARPRISPLGEPWLSAEVDEAKAGPSPRYPVVRLTTSATKNQTRPQPAVQRSIVMEIPAATFALGEAAIVMQPA